MTQHWSIDHGGHWSLASLQVAGIALAVAGPLILAAWRFLFYRPTSPGARACRRPARAIERAAGPVIDHIERRGTQLAQPRAQAIQAWRYRQIEQATSTDMEVWQ